MKYLHTCPCGQQFNGRKNRKYHSPQCKQNINNEVASERRAAAAPHEKILRSNFRILAKLYQVYGRDAIPIKVLKTHDFDSKVFTGIRNAAGKQLVEIHTLAYEVDNKTQTIKIINS
jgi:hypothetical protein